MLKLGRLVILVGVLAIFVLNANAADDRPTEVVVPAAPGGGSDITGRIMAAQLAQDLGSGFVVMNKAGASSLIGTKFVSEAKPDGFTLLLGSTQALTVQHLVENAGFDAARDLTPVVYLGSTPYVFVVNPKIPVSNPADLVAWAKANPGKFTWGHGGVGGVDYLVQKQFNIKAGISALSVSYRGSGPALVATMSGEVAATAVTVPTARAAIAAGRVKALGVFSSRETELLPGVKTVASHGFPDLEGTIWYALLGPRDMPRNLVQALHEKFRRSLSSPAFKEKMLASGLQVNLSNSSEEFARYYKAEHEKYDNLFKVLNSSGALDEDRK